MHYFFYYKNEFIAYTDCKKMKKAFIKEFHDRDNLEVEKIKKLSEEVLEDEIIDNHKLYLDHYVDMTINEHLLEEIDRFAEQIVDEMTNRVDSIYHAVKNMKLSKKEESILDDFIGDYVIMLEDCEALYNDFLNVKKILVDYVYPSITNTYV